MRPTHADTHAMSERTLQFHSPVTAVITAAGLSSRFRGGNKLLEILDDEPLIRRTVGNAKAAGIDDIVVVTGADRAQIERAVSGMECRCVFNPAFESGLAGSIVSGVAVAHAHHNVLIWPGDMPFVRSETASRIIRNGDPDWIVVPVYSGRRGHPVLFGRSFRKELNRLSGDRGAKAILLRHPDAVKEIEVMDPGIVTDVDTVDDLPNVTND